MANSTTFYPHISIPTLCSPKYDSSTPNPDQKTKLPPAEEIPSPIQPTSLIVHFNLALSNPNADIDDPDFSDDITETQEDLNQSWVLLNHVGKAASEEKWITVHKLINLIREPFWKDSGYSLCSYLALNAAIENRTINSMARIVNFYEKISNKEQKELVQYNIEIMMYHKKKVSESAPDDLPFNSLPGICPLLHPEEIITQARENRNWIAVKNAIFSIPDIKKRDALYQESAIIIGREKPASTDSLEKKQMLIQEFEREAYVFCSLILNRKMRKRTTEILNILFSD